mmetsp:Transcript_8211/g.15238  ORF Transcript_8211/g.15238 Transcript_8211/m.15238 type:complete len:88 (-) Transcript_8211:49-312(-)
MPANPYSNPYGRSAGQSQFEKCARTAGMGFALGGALGTTLGVLVGFPTAMANPKIAGRRIRYVAKVCMQTGGTFGVFVAAGFLLRGC